MVGHWGFTDCREFVAAMVTNGYFLCPKENSGLPENRSIGI
jgi:hypothetical protein